MTPPMSRGVTSRPVPWRAGSSSGVPNVSRGCADFTPRLKKVSRGKTGEGWPASRSSGIGTTFARTGAKVMGAAGIEPATPAV